MTPFLSLFLPNLLHPNLLRPEIQSHSTILHDICIVGDFPYRKMGVSSCVYRLDETINQRISTISKIGKGTVLK